MDGQVSQDLRSSQGALSIASAADGSFPAATPIINVSCGKVKAHSLNIRFDGRSCVFSFVERLEELCSSRDISDDELLKGLVELFVDDALIWYRSVRSKVKTWSDVKTLLFEDYLPYDYEEQLLDEIRARTQGHSENIVTYLSVMQNYFNRLPTPLSEAQKLHIVVKNVRPFYSSQLALTSVDSWESFKLSCRKLECARQRSERFTEPPSSLSTMVAPDLAFQQVARANKPCAIVTRSGPCVNCRADTHNVAQCPQPALEPICYRCGEKGFNAKTCRKCRPKKSMKMVSSVRRSRSYAQDWEAWCRTVQRFLDKPKSRDYGVSSAATRISPDASVNESTSYSPFLLVHGREAVVDGDAHGPHSREESGDVLRVESRDAYVRRQAPLKDIFEKVSSELKRAHERNAKYYNNKRRHADFAVGDFVWKRTYKLSSAPKHFSAKLAPRKNIGTWHVKDFKSLDVDSS